MNWQLIKFIQKGFARAGKESYFLKFTRSVAFIGVMLGSIALILSLSILDGYEEKLYDSVEKLSAHIKISSFKNDLIPYSDEIIQNLKNNFPDITDISPIIKTEALIRSKEGVESIAIQAYENYEKINKNNDITSKIVDGNKGFSSLIANEVIIGKKLAKKLNIRINEEIFIFTITDKTDNNFTLPDINKFKVIGIYETGMAQFDDINIYIPFKTVQSMIKIPDGYVSEYSIWLKSITNLNETTDKIQEFLGFPFFVTNIYQNFTSIFSWIELQKEPIPLVLGLITIVACLI
jgi:lipoprotein-releasing system permease protein